MTKSIANYKTQYKTNTGQDTEKPSFDLEAVLTNTHKDDEDGNCQVLSKKQTIMKEYYLLTIPFLKHTNIRSKYLSM